MEGRENEEIDCWGYWMAPDFYRLGMALRQERYEQIARVMFNYCYSDYLAAREDVW